MESIEKYHDENEKQKILENIDKLLAPETARQIVNINSIRQENRKWTVAFSKLLPKRKGNKVEVDNNEDNKEDEDDDVMHSEAHTENIGFIGPSTRDCMFEDITSTDDENMVIPIERSMERDKNNGNISTPTSILQKLKRNRFNKKNKAGKVKKRNHVNKTDSEWRDDKVVSNHILSVDESQSDSHS